MRAMLLSFGMMFGVAASEIEVLNLEVISYEAFVNEDAQAMQVLKSALHENGIVGIKGVPGYREKVQRYIDAARAFSALPEEVKESYAPNRALGDTFLGYERGSEKFKNSEGEWLVDDQKVSYYAYIPEDRRNKWPKEVDIKTPILNICMLMSEMGASVMTKIGLIGAGTGRALGDAPRVSRMLHYRNRTDCPVVNPYWCSAHFDHSMLTTLIPGYYFLDGKPIPEPLEAGLFVKTPKDGVFKKVMADDPDVMLFQVGEFAQLTMNDEIRATEHRVQRASGDVERYGLALFCDAPMDMVIHSTSVLTQDARYGAASGMPCTYKQWNDESFKRYLAK